MKSTPLPHISRAREEDHLRTFLLARLQPRAGVPKALLLNGPPGAGKKTLLRRVFESDPRFRAYQLLDATSREILSGTSRPGAWKEPAVDAVGALVGAANPAAAVAAGFLSPFVKGLVSSESAPNAFRDPFLEDSGKPLLIVVPRIDSEDGNALAYHAYRIREAHDRALPHALVILDDSPLLEHNGADAGVSRSLAALRRFLGDDRRLDVLPLSAFSEAECTEAFSGLGLSADWTALMYRLSDGGVAELCSLWGSLQTAGMLVQAGKGRWKTMQSSIASTEWTLVRDTLAALLKHRISRGTPHKNRLLDACQLAASMGSTFLPQAVAECIFEVDPKRDELNRAEWEDLGYDVLEYEDVEHHALAGPSISEEHPKVLQGDGRQCFVYSFCDLGLTNLLRSATRQMWVEWMARGEAERPHELLVAGNQALEAWIGRTFQETWSQALTFRVALLRVSNRNWEAGRLEALDYRLRLLEKLGIQIEDERRRVTNGKEAGDLYAFLLWYGETLRDLGNYAEEADALSEAKVLADRGHISLSAAGRANLQANLGVSLMNHGAYPQAETLLLDTLNLSLERLGDDHLATLTSAYSLAVLYERQGRYDEAEPLFLRALEGGERVLGPEHPETLGSVGSLAELYESQGRYDEAETLYLRALEGQERVLGPEHPHTFTSVHSLAGLYESQGRYDEAEPLFLRALEGLELVLGPEHPVTLVSVGTLARLYESQGRYDEAEPLYLRALEGQERVLGPEHPHTFTSVHNLAGLYKRQARYNEAESLLLRAVKGQERVLGPEHPHTFTSVGSLARLYESQGRYDEAEPLYQRALEGHVRVLGPEHPHTFTFLRNFGSLYERQGRYDEAESLYLRAVQGHERVLGANHPETVDSVNSLASLHKIRGPLGGW